MEGNFIDFITIKPVVAAMTQLNCLDAYDYILRRVRIEVKLPRFKAAHILKASFIAINVSSLIIPTFSLHPKTFYKINHICHYLRCVGV